MIGLPAALLLVGCSASLGNEGRPGTAGSSGTGGMIDGTAGRGGTGGAGGRGGTGGPSVPDLACPTGTPTFSVCVVNDADVLPLPISGTGGMAGRFRDSVTNATASVEAVGTGSAPAQCENARVFGAAATTDWWFQVRTADKKLWTIGLSGLGNAPVLKTGDSVTLDLTYERTTDWGSVPIGPVRVDGYVQLSNATRTPLLWAGTSAGYSATWLQLNKGQALCTITSAQYDCPSTRYEVMATVNGSVAAVAPFSAANVGGYYLAVGEYNIGMPRTQSSCVFDAPPPFAAAAVKIQ